MKSKEVFEKTMRMPIGREFNSEKVFRDMIRPAVSLHSSLCSLLIMLQVIFIMPNIVHLLFLLGSCFKKHGNLMRIILRFSIPTSYLSAVSPIFIY